eukprot:378615-Pyramimonas_sp.AAC.1
MEAMGPAVPKEHLRNPGRFPRLDLMISTNLIDKFTKLRKHRNLSVHHNHSPRQANRMEFAARNEQRLLTGRDVAQAICCWCSVRSKLGQHRISRDIFKVVTDPNRSDADLWHF